MYKVMRGRVATLQLNKEHQFEAKLKTINISRSI